MNNAATEMPCVLNGIQRSLWLFQELAGDIGLYNVVITVSMQGHLMVPAMERVLQDIDRDCPALRTAFRFDGDDLCGVVRDSKSPPLQVKLLGSDSTGLDDQISEAGALSIDLTSGRLWHYVLLRLPDLTPETGQRYVLLLTFHHIAVDGNSIVFLLEKMAAGYRQLLGMERPAVPAVREFHNCLPIEPSDLAFWRKMLTGAPPPTLLPGQAASAIIGDFTGFTTPLTLAGVSARRLRMLAASRGVTVHTAVLSCVVRALATLTGTMDLLLGILVSRRTADVPIDAVGQFSGAFPVCFDVAGATSAVTVLDRVAACVRDVLGHPRVDPDSVFNALRAERADHDGLGVQVVFAWDERPPAPELPGLEVSWCVEFNGWCEWGVTLELMAEGDRITGQYFGRRESLADVDLQEFTEHIAACGQDLLAELGGEEVQG